jgi:hypothetical protein
MHERITIDLFVEDRAHEAIVGALTARLVRETGTVAEVRVRSARGGTPRVFNELITLRQILIRGGVPTPDLLVVAVDGNCETSAKVRRKVHECLGRGAALHPVAACPDPHVERWLFADPAAFARVAGVQPRLAKRKCARDYYKAMLAKILADAGHPLLLGGLEYAADIVDAMDLYEAGRNDASLRHFVDDLRSRLRELARRTKV